MTGRVEVRRTAPWVLCGISLALLVVGNAYRWVVRDQAGQDLVWLDGFIASLGFVGLPVVGALIASRLPANPIGWLWCATGMAFGLSDAADPLARVLGWPSWTVWLIDGFGFVTATGLFVFVFLLFPDGRLPTPGWRWVARAAVTCAVLLILMLSFISAPWDPTSVTPWAPHGTAARYLFVAANVVLFALFGVALVAMSSLVVRVRGAGPVERRQLTWFLYATALNAGVLVLDSVLGLLPSSLPTVIVEAVTFALLPVAVGVAVLRYRLYEIDRLVSRTVSYGLLTGVLLVLYLLLVRVLGTLLEPLTGTSSLAVAGSTLVVATAFNPIRRRLQGLVDRRFDRARYDAARAVEDFAARLRDQVDIDEIEAGLRQTVSATVAPSRIGLWLQNNAGGPA